MDIILWDENPAQYVINAMSPAEVVSIVVDEESRAMDVAVHEEQLSQAIGRGGQNVRLASQLTQWQINVMTEQQADEKNELEAGKFLSLFRDQLDVDEEVALILLQEGFTSIEEVPTCPRRRCSRSTSSTRISAGNCSPEPAMCCSSERSRAKRASRAELRPRIFSSSTAWTPSLPTDWRPRV